MKKRLYSLGFVVVFGTLVLTSCGNSESKNPNLQEPATAEMKDNGQDNKNEDKSVQTSDAKAKTTEDLLAAFKGETTASAKYAAYSKKAEQEGYYNIALLFKAASVAENIHANNHKSVLEESGVQTPAITPEFTVKSTKENLEDAIKGESYEASTMYPEFIKDASAAKNQLALISLNYAFETEKKHKTMYENALSALTNNSAKDLSVTYYVCATCGNTYDVNPPKRCGICMTGSEKFLKISTL